jgi:hypothetical protein
MAKTRSRAKAGRTTPKPPASTAVAAREASQTAAARPGVKFKVRALRMGYYDHIRRREGDVFLYTMGPKETKLPSWVERVSDRTPERVTTGVQELRQKHDEILQSRMPSQGTPLVNDQLADGEQNPLGE